MKKSLIALAVISATGSAFAQSSVSIYGVMDAGYNQVTTTTAVPAVSAAPGVWSLTQTDIAATATTPAIPAGTPRQGAGTPAVAAFSKEDKVRASGGNAAGAWASNRIGFRGTEDLGGGTTANFMYELGLAAGTNGNLGTTDVRSSWISLANKNLGEVTIGRQYNPIFLTSASLDAGRANNVAFGRVLYGQIATTRTSGGINYTSPNFNGFVVKAIVGQNETDSLNTVSGVTTANPANASVMGGNISYTLGDLNLQYATHKTNLTATAAAGDRTENLFGGTYTFGNIKALAMYGSAKVKDGVGAQSAKREGYQLGLQASLNGAFNTPGGIDLFATYGSADVQAASDSPERTTKGTQLGGMYNLSKRTGVYAAYGKTTGTLTSSLFTSQGNEFAVGVRHSF